MIGSVLGLISMKYHLFYFLAHKLIRTCSIPNLHCNLCAINQNILSQKIGTNCCFVMAAKTLVYVLVHQTCFPNA